MPSVAFNSDEDLLTSYLVMAHHRKVRVHTGFHWIKEEDGRLHGVKSGDTLPIVPRVTDKPITIQTPADLGVRWNDIYSYCLDTYGIFRLIEMESIVRNGDVRSSKLHQEGLNEEE